MGHQDFHGGAEASTPSQKMHPRDVERFIDISGATPEGRPKGRILLRYYHQYDLNETRDVQEPLTIEKPIISVFKRAGYANVYLDFGSRYDRDLRVLWDLLTEYCKPENSVSYLPEELEAGEYDTPAGKKPVYFPVLELALSPIGKEAEYMFIGYNPAFFTLQPSNPTSEPCVVQFTFDEENFFVFNDLKPIDYSAIQAEVLAELEMEEKQNHSM